MEKKSSAIKGIEAAKFPGYKYKTSSAWCVWGGVGGRVNNFL